MREGWGIKVAARIYHIALTGFDAEIDGQYKSSTPTTITMHAAKTVPSSPQQCKNLFDLSQILVWLAKERRDVQEQFELWDKISELVKTFNVRFSLNATLYTGLTLCIPLLFCAWEGKEKPPRKEANSKSHSTGIAPQNSP